MAKGNPSPTQTEEFKSKQFKPLGDVPGDIPLAKRVFAIKLPSDVQEAIDALPKEKRLTWARRVLTNAARSELIEQNN